MFGHPLQFLVLSCMCLVVNCSNIGATRQDINLHSDGGYTDILVGISDRIAENTDIIDKLKAYFMSASKVLLTATINRLYFRNVTILVPKTWTAYPSSTQPGVNETYNRARVVVEEPNIAWGDVPYTLQPGGCGEEGDYIHLTPDYLTKDPDSDFRHRPAKRLVREFSHLKWGLFDEDVPITDKISSRFYPSNEELLPIGCAGGFFGKQKDANGNPTCSFNSGNGLYPPSCLFDATKTPHQASLLNFEYLDEIVHFCDALQHNKAAPNRQNSKCDGMSAWEVMETLKDFEIDYSVTRNGQMPPEPTFHIIQQPTPTITSTSNAPTTTAAMTNTLTSTPEFELTTTSTVKPEVATSCKQDIVCLCLDVSGSMDTANRIGILSQSVQAYILSFLRNGTAVGMVSFSYYPTVLAGMTEIADSTVRENLASVVPTRAGGGTGIGGGLHKCQKLLQDYAGSNIGNTRILLLTDGAENESPSVKSVLPSLIADEILIDTVLYGNDAVSYSIAAQTGGKEHFASDKTGSESLDLFFTETASRNCEEGFGDVIIQNAVVVIEAGIFSHSDVLYLDATIGVNTKLVFKYNTGEINVTVTTPQNNPVTINAYPASRVIEAIIEGRVETQVDYTITKKYFVSSAVSIVMSATAGPIPGVQPIVITDRVNGADISFSAETQLVGYVGIFQGLTPVFGVSINIIMEQSDGSVSTISYVDDGTGKDSISNDGIYTGFTPAHNINSGGFLSLKMEVSGEGFLPSSPFATSSRRKRCVNCGSSLGNFSRTAAGNVVNIQNWHAVKDSTPPQKITDARVTNAAADGSNIFAIGWTAPGDDLNIGQVASYEFAVAVNTSLPSLVTLPEEAILSNISTYLVPAGAELKLRINASQINATIFGMDDSTDVSTYYFRIRSTDAAGNAADWSNPVSASYINPLLYTTTTTTTTTPTTTPTTTTTTTTPTTTTTTTTTTATTTTSTAKNITAATNTTTTPDSSSTMEAPVYKVPVVAIAVSISFLLVLGILVVIIFCCCCKRSKRMRHPQPI